jgi:hypothetical protein
MTLHWSTYLLMSETDPNRLVEDELFQFTQTALNTPVMICKFLDDVKKFL